MKRQKLIKTEARIDPIFTSNQVPQILNLHWYYILRGICNTKMFYSIDPWLNEAPVFIRFGNLALKSSLALYL